MNKTKKAFFDLVSEYKTINGDTFAIYEFEKTDIEGIKWFLEMLWSISKYFDIRVLAETANEKVQIFLRTENIRWELY